jgi:hypothetical protein
MTDIEERFAGNGHDGSLIERQLLSGASVKRKSRTGPTENRFANFTPMRFCWSASKGNQPSITLTFTCQFVVIK